MRICSCSLLILLIVSGLSCKEPSWKAITGKRLNIEFVQTASIEDGTICYLDSLVLMHGKHNNEKLLSGDTIFLNSGQYLFTGSDGKEKLQTSTPAEQLNKLNFILKNYLPFSRRYQTSPEMSALKSAKLEIARTDGQAISFKFPVDYPVQVTVIDSVQATDSIP